MCGIAGLVPSDPRLCEGPGPRADVAVMLSALAHRGPDGVGIEACGGALLGHRRLAIIDLSPRAAQPMPLRCRAESGPDGAPRAWIAFNGEIYNYVELRRELEGRGHVFFSASDTEVILHLHEEAGESLLPRLRGMFAFALWDARRRTLLLARDRMGEKPLYYAVGPDGLVFASELKAIAALRRARGAPVEEDPAALRSYLALKYVPGPSTALRGVAKLPPGHLLTWRAGGVTLRRWWSLPEPPPASGATAPAAAEALRQELRERLGEAVRMQLRSDVPLGLFLSGGVDSGVLACLMAEAAPGRLRAFTIGFEEADYDEVPAAADLARRVGAEHVPIPMRADPMAIADALPELAWRLDQPFADSSALAVHRLAREVRRHVTVALSGDGGDELFLGYDRYRAHRLAGRLERLPGATAGLPGRLLRAASGAAGRRNLAGRTIRFAAALGLPPLARNDAWIACFDPDAVRRTFTADFLAAAESSGAADPLQAVHDAYAVAGGGPMAAIQRADLSVWLPDDVLHKTDSMTMAHALESRAPFLDAEVVALAMRIPGALKLGGGLAGRGKAILRDAFAGSLPAPTRRRRKAGFGLPLDHWLRGDLADWARDVLLSAASLSRGMLRRAGVEALLEEHRDGRANHDDAIWCLVMLEHWRRAFLEETGRAADVSAGAAGGATA